MRITSYPVFLTVLIILPVLSLAQYTLTGRVRDSIGYLAGVNVEVVDQKKSTITTAGGVFEIDSKTPSAILRFSFLGLLTRDQTVIVGKETTVMLTEDATFSSYSTHDVKHSFAMGYFGDIGNAPIGGIVDYRLQSIGKTQVEAYTNFRYWSFSPSRGVDVSVGKVLTGRGVMPEHILISYRHIRQAKAFEIEQVRAMMTTELGRGFSFDLGGAYQEKLINDEAGVSKNSYYSAIAGISKAFGMFHGMGVNASLNFHPHTSTFETGVYKKLYFKNGPLTVAMAKYCHFDLQPMMILSLRFYVFNTHYYCCSSWLTAVDKLGSLK